MVLPKNTLSAVHEQVVGRHREIELTLAALTAQRHIVLEGPPGTGKSTLLRAIAQAMNVGFVFVEGNAELTPARLATPRSEKPSTPFSVSSASAASISAARRLP